MIDLRRQCFPNNQSEVTRPRQVSRRVTNKVLTGAVHVPADNSLPGRSPPWRAAQPLLPRRPDDRGHGGDRHGGVAAPRDQGEVRHQRSVGVL